MTDIEIQPLEMSSGVAASSVVAAQLLTMIHTGALGPGQALPAERDLSRMFGVSRTTVREAILELTLKGVVRRRQGSGTVIAPTSSSMRLIREMSDAARNAEEAIDFRTIFEPQIAALAASRRTESDLVLMGRLCSPPPAGWSPEESLENDQRFHQAVAGATHNRLIVSLSQVASEWLASFRMRSHLTAEARTASCGGHQRILAAITAQDEALAAELMATHIADMGSLNQSDAGGDDRSGAADGT